MAKTPTKKTEFTEGRSRTAFAPLPFSLFSLEEAWLITKADGGRQSQVEWVVGSLRSNKGRGERHLHCGQAFQKSNCRGLPTVPMWTKCIHALYLELVFFLKTQISNCIRNASICASVWIGIGGRSYLGLYMPEKQPQLLLESATDVNFQFTLEHTVLWCFF